MTVISKMLFILILACMQISLTAQAEEIGIGVGESEDRDLNKVWEQANEKIKLEHKSKTASMRDQAQDQKNRANKAVRYGYASAAAAGVLAAANCPQNGVWCAIGLGGVALSMKGIANAKKSRAQSEQTMRDLDTSTPNLLAKPNVPNPDDLNPQGKTVPCDDEFCSDDDSNNTGDSKRDLKNLSTNPNASSTARQMATQIVRAIEKSEKEGSKIDFKNNTITFPNGKTVSIDSMATPSGLAAAGFSSKDMNAFQNAMKDIDQKASKFAESADASTGGGKGLATKSGKGAAAAATNFRGGKSVNNGAPIDRNLASVAGLAKSDGNGGRIGVAGDELFQMINRNFEKNTPKGYFIDPTLGF